MSYTDITANKTSLLCSRDQFYKHIGSVTRVTRRVIYGAGTAYPSGAFELTPDF